MAPPTWTAPHLPLHLTPLGCHRIPSGALSVIWQLPINYLFYVQYGVCFNATVSINPTLSFPWTSRRPNQSILKKICPEYLLEGLMLKLKHQKFWPPDVKNWLLRKDPDAGKDWRQKGMTGREMFDSLWTWVWASPMKVGDGQEGLAYGSWWGHKEPDMTEWLNWTEHLLLVYPKSVLHEFLFLLCR